MISNGEYMPFPQTEKQKHVEFRVKELADKAAKRLGLTRRQFLESTGGLAASFLAMNEVFGNTFFKVSPVEMFEPAAAAENGPPRICSSSTIKRTSCVQAPMVDKACARLRKGPVRHRRLEDSLPIPSTVSAGTRRASMSSGAPGRRGTRRSSSPTIPRIQARPSR